MGGGRRDYRKWKSPVHPANVKGTVTFKEGSQPAKGRLAGSSPGINYPALTFLPLAIPCRGIGTYLSGSQGAKEPNDLSAQVHGTGQIVDSGSKEPNNQERAKQKESSTQTQL